MWKKRNDTENSEFHAYLRKDKPLYNFPTENYLKVCGRKISQGKSVPRGIFNLLTADFMVRVDSSTSQLILWSA
jgi:hypothetical protein